MKPVYLGLLIGGATLALMMTLAIAGYRLGYDKATDELEAKAARQAATLALAHAKREAELEKARAQAEQLAYDQLKKVQRENDRLTAAVRSGGIRLQVRSLDCLPEQPDAPGMVTGAGRAQLHPEAAAALIGITRDADDLAVRHNALINWVKEGSKP